MQLLKLAFLHLHIWVQFFGNFLLTQILLQIIYWLSLVKMFVDKIVHCDILFLCWKMEGRISKKVGTKFNFLKIFIFFKPIIIHYLFVFTNSNPHGCNHSKKAIVAHLGVCLQSEVSYFRVIVGYWDWS